MRYATKTIKRNSRRLAVLLVIGLTAISLASNASARLEFVTPSATVSPVDDQTDMVLEWNANAIDAIVGVAGMRPERGLIRLAMVHIAIYDAVNAIEGYPLQPYGISPSVVLPSSPEAATAAAAHDVLIALFPDQKSDLDAKYAASLAKIFDGPAKVNGITVGEQTANGMLALRANDGRDAVVTYTPGSGPGVWIPTPPAFLPAAAPEAAHVQPFAINSPSQFRPEAPPALTSDTWARDYNEVKSLGASVGSTRTPEQTDIGRFWADQPILQWNRAWRKISIEHRLSLQDNARYFALLATATADAIIACWDSKFTYNFWRPVTAIRAGDTDGNPETAPDANWLAQVPTPNHPEYPAAHGCFSGASTQTLKFFFGTDDFAFTIDSKIAGLTNPIRYYNSFSQALDEVCNARVYGGMHYRNSTRKGRNIGKQVSHYVTSHYFLPSRGRNSNNN
jgi:hypothetical protein